MWTQHVWIVVWVLAIDWVLAGSGPRQIPLSAQQMRDIVFVHNKLRESVSSSNMRAMSWDQELASISRTYGTKCQFSHNTRAVHSKFKTNVGENIYVSQFPVDSFEDSTAIQLWFDEKKDFNYYARTCAAGKKCGHYTQVVWAETYKVGCSLTMCDYVSGFERPKAHLFICNYSPAGNVYSNAEGTRKMLQPFRIGSACSKCQTTTDTCNSKLCSIGNGSVKIQATSLRQTIPQRHTSFDSVIQDAQLIAGQFPYEHPTKLTTAPSNSQRDSPIRFVSPSVTKQQTSDSESAHQEVDVYQTSTGQSLLTAVIILSLIIVALVIYIVYRERVRLNLVLQLWKTNKSTDPQHKNFSNQNTPCPSRSTTPRHSLITLHGIGPPQPCKPDGSPYINTPTNLHVPPAPPRPAKSPYKPGRPPAPPSKI